MWARARYHLRLSSEEFWRLTPRQFHLLWEEHRQHMVHVEMLHAFTTASIRNGFASFAGGEGVSMLDFMPSHRAAQAQPTAVPELTPEQERARTAWLAKRAQLAAEIRAGGGPCLEKLKRGEAI